MEMRGGGRCPPFLVAGLLVICIVLAFNWWSLSVHNYELLKELDHLGEQLKICSDEQDVCSHQRLSSEGRIKSLDGEIATLRVHEEQLRVGNEEFKKQIADLNDEVKSLTKQYQDEQSTSVMCHTELESLKKLDISKDGTIATLRLEKERFGSQLEERKQEVQKLRLEIEEIGVNLKAEQARSRGSMMIIPTPKTNALNNNPHNGDLKVVNTKQISVKPVGFKGIVPRGAEILPQDPPNAVRPKPQYSVTYLKKAGVSVGRLEHGDISVGGNHDQAQAADADKAENEENNAGERGDDPNVENEAQLEEAERMEEANDVADDTKKNSIDVIANRI